MMRAKDGRYRASVKRINDTFRLSFLDRDKARRVVRAGQVLDDWRSFEVSVNTRPISPLPRPCAWHHNHLARVPRVHLQVLN